MKAKLLLVTCFWTTVSVAQITISQSDFPAVGDIWVSFSDDRVNVHPLTPAGPNQSWDYSAAFLVNDTSVLQFINPAATPAGWASNYPNATHAIYSPLDTMAQYFIGQTNGFYLDGIYSGAQGSPFPVMDFNPNQLAVPTPFTFNSTRSNTSIITIDMPAAPPVHATRTKLYTITTFSGDAWGSLITPSGNYPSTLRVKQASVSVDSTFMDLLGTGVYTFLQSGGFSDTTTTYTWLKNGTGALLMTIDVSGTTGQSDGAEYYSFGPLNVPEQIDPTNVLVYPNPAIEFVNFELGMGDLAEIRIFDLSGRLVRTENVKGVNKLVMSTNQFDKGIYIFYLTDNSGNVVRNGKFMVGQ
jgi:Secretion system C-terminal sorting domain